MESHSAVKIPKAGTPVKDPHGSQGKIQEVTKLSENSNPNISRSSPVKPTNSPLIKSAKSQKPAHKNPSANPSVFSPRNKIRERKFVVAKKNPKKEKAGAISKIDCKCRERFGGNLKKCLCVAYETLRASQEEFFKNRGGAEDDGEFDFTEVEACEGVENEGKEEIEKSLGNGNGHGSDDQDPCEIKKTPMISFTIKRRRERLLEEARSSVPESGMVAHLVQAFEKLKTIPNSKELDTVEEKETEEKDADEKNIFTKKIPKWALPGLQPPQVPGTETQVSSCSSFCPSDLLLTAENLGLDPRASVSSSWDSSHGSVSSRTSNGGRRSRRNSAESCATMGGGRRWKKQQKKITCQKPFNLRTEQRGRAKEEEFTKKIQELMTEEEKLRIPIAQGLPWTTDEPECLIKPPVKENTRPVDLKLHSDVRAVERAEFDHQVAEKMSLIEQYKMERERQQKLAEEEEIRRLRKELVPKAQPMPYFDRPFIPRRSVKHPTIPREPKFHMPEHKKIKCCLSWNDSYTCQQN